MLTSSGRSWSLEKYNPVPGVLPETPANNDYDGMCVYICVYGGIIYRNVHFIHNLSVVYYVIVRYILVYKTYYGVVKYSIVLNIICSIYITTYRFLYTGGFSVT